MLPTKEWIALITGILGLAGTVVAVIRYFIKKEQMEGEMKRLAERYSELDGQHKELLQEVGAIKATGTAVFLIKSGIDGELELAMKALQASASSILVPLPAREPSHLVFLSVHGPAAPKLRRSVISIKKGIAGFVFSRGKPYLAVDARSDKQFFKGMDAISSYTTIDMMCLPIRSAEKIIGVMQFLNKSGNQEFTQHDLQIAERFADSLGSKVADFITDVHNFELLGFSPVEESLEGTVVFCDLTASSLLFDAMDFTSAISLMNSYLERNCDIVMKHGGTVDKFLGDGAMFRFNVPLQIRDHRVRAIQAAVEMKNDFENLKASWLNAGIPASSLQTRIGVASGRLHEAIMGHPQYQSLTVMGEPVVIAANLCAGASRERSIILTDENSLQGLERQIQARAVSQASLKKIKGNSAAVSEVIAFTHSASEDN